MRRGGCGGAWAASAGWGALGELGFELGDAPVSEAGAAISAWAVVSAASALSARSRQDGSWSSLPRVLGVPVLLMASLTSARASGFA